MVYCAESLALAVLESFVHFDSSDLPDDYVAVAVEIPDDAVIEELDTSTLPPDWSDMPGPDALRTIGSDWINSQRTVILSVPSAVIRQERNFLLNPDHPDFLRLKAQPAEPFHFDSRMKKAPSAAPPAKVKAAATKRKSAATKQKPAAPKPKSKRATRPK